MRGVSEAEFLVARKFRRLRLHPCDIGIDTRRVDDEKKHVTAKAEDVEIVDNAAALVAHERVLADAGGELIDVIREKMIEEFHRSRAADSDFAHVRDVENA